MEQLFDRIAEGDVEALFELRDRVLHQGNVTDETVTTVPRLAALLDTELADLIVRLLGDMANIVDTGDPDLVELRDAVTAEIDRILPLLAHEDPSGRSAAAFALAQCPGRAADSLQAFHRPEPDPWARGNIVIAAVKLDPSTGLYSRALSDEDPIVRAAAALAAAHGGLPCPVDAVREGWQDHENTWYVDMEAEAYHDWYLWGWDPIEDLLERFPEAATILRNSPDPVIRRWAERLASPTRR